MDEQEFDNGKIKILAYFTLSHKSLVSDNISKSKIQNASGFKDSKSIHFVLIGQLGKYIERIDETELKTNITSKTILDYAFEVIRASSNLIPCRCALVECNENKKVHSVYLEYGFKEFQFDGEHHQFYKKI